MASPHQLIKRQVEVDELLQKYQIKRSDDFIPIDDLSVLINRVAAAENASNFALALNRWYEDAELFLEYWSFETDKERDMRDKYEAVQLQKRLMRERTKEQREAAKEAKERSNYLRLKEKYGDA